MLQDYLRMLDTAEIYHEYDIEEGTINIYNEDVAVTIVTVTTDENLNKVRCVFHRGTESLIDMEVVRGAA